MNNYSLLIILISELLAIFLVWKIWKRNDHLIMKLALSIIAFVPIIGLFFAAWIINIPTSQPEHLQVRGARGDFFHKFKAGNVHRKKRND